jgi:hypothetical protein
MEILKEFKKIPSPRREVYFLKCKQLANKSRYTACLDNLSYCLSAQATSSMIILIFIVVKKHNCKLFDYITV